MKKTFKEVISSITPEQEWININEKSNLKKIKSDVCGNIELSMLNVSKYLNFNLEEKFKLLKKVSFVEAMKSYNEGKEIQSCYSKNKYILIEGKHYIEPVGSYIRHCSGSMQINEINNLWYVNA